MAKETINNGTFDNDQTAEKIRTAFEKVNNMFTEIYSLLSTTGLDGYLTKSQYDPDGIGDDMFSMDNMKESITKKIMTNIERANFAAAYGWGNHAAAGYLTSETPETDPVFSAWLNNNPTNVVKIGSFTVYKKPGNANPSILESGDMVIGWFGSNEFWIPAIYIGGLITEKTSFNIITPIEIP